MLIDLLRHAVLVLLLVFGTVDRRRVAAHLVSHIVLAGLRGSV